MTTARATTRAPNVEELRNHVRGRVITDRDSDYADARRLWNRMVDRRPLAIVRVADADDAAAALQFARDRGLPISIRGGGHNVSGSALVDGGVVIDHSARRDVRVDPGRRIIEVDPGVLLGELDAATSVHLLSVPVGVNTTTGVAGLTLGGGIGWLMRRDGLTCDHLEAADVVLADGSTVRVDESRTPDLLWALRGGGGNFGIVTKFVFRAVPLGREVLAGLAFFSMDEGESVMRRYRDWAAGLRTSITTIAVLRTILPGSPVPAELHGRRVVGIAICDAETADTDDAEVLAEIRSFGTQLASTIRRKPFTEHQAALDRTVPAGNDYYWKSHFLAGLPDEAIDILIDHHRRTPTIWSYSLIPQLGGAIGRVDESATAYANRAAPFAVNVNGVSPDASDREAIVAWTRACFDALTPYSTGGVYVNFLGEEGDDRTRAAYGSAYRRLADIKARYDPDNVFRVNQNIRPISSTAGAEAPLRP